MRLAARAIACCAQIVTRSRPPPMCSVGMLTARCRNLSALFRLIPSLETNLRPRGAIESRRDGVAHDRSGRIGSPKARFMDVIVLVLSVGSFPRCKGEDGDIGAISLAFVRIIFIIRRREDNRHD